MIVLHGWFDLKDPTDEGEFRQAFERFADHLKATQLVGACRCMCHRAHDGYNTHPPWANYYVSIEFPDMGCAEKCWVNIEENNETLKPLHADVFSRICNYRFSLTSDISHPSPPSAGLSETGPGV